MRPGGRGECMVLERPSVAVVGGVFLLRRVMPEALVASIFWFGANATMDHATMELNGERLQGHDADAGGGGIGMGFCIVWDWKLNVLRTSAMRPG